MSSHHQENSIYNALLARVRSKRKRRPIDFGIATEPGLAPDQVLAELLGMGVRVDIRTIQRYAKDGLCPRPTSRGLGRGKGQLTTYPAGTPGEVFASWRLIHGLRLSKHRVREIRRLAKVFEAAIDEFWESIEGPYNEEEHLDAAQEFCRQQVSLTGDDWQDAKMAEFWWITSGVRGREIWDLLERR